jgi:hypothetical protein
MTRTTWAWIALAAFLLPLQARAGDGTDYLRRFNTDWKGGGSASLNLHLPNFGVSCHLSPTSGPSSIRLSGLCRLSILPFLSQSIDTTLTYDSRTDSYSGTYSVDRGPPAILLGRQIGDNLNLDVTWPILVNGHTKAKIYISNDGRGHFALTTVDPLGLHGVAMKTSDLHFTPQ